MPSHRGDSNWGESPNSSILKRVLCSQIHTTSLAPSRGLMRQLFISSNNVIFQPASFQVLLSLSDWISTVFKQATTTDNLVPNSMIKEAWLSHWDGHKEVRPPSVLGQGWESAQTSTHEPDQTSACGHPDSTPTAGEASGTGKSLPQGRNAKTTGLQACFRMLRMS